MNELQRQAYLDALGVEQYVPRWLMPCAPAPELCELPEVVEEVPKAPAEPVQRHQPASESAPAAVADVLEGMRRPEPKRAPEKAPEPAPEPSPVAAERVSPFTLSIWRSPLPLLVLDARQPRAALPTDRLLHNLLRAIGAHDPQGITEEVLPWPLVDNPAMRPTAEDARAELRTWLDAELSSHPVRYMLLMGENAARHFLPEGQSYQEALGRIQTLPDFDIPALVAPSLVELLRDPSLKRPLWLALQAWLPLTQ